MSIAVLTQVYGECRRLAAAGSGVARGDFRLKKLLPSLDQAGAKAPVFARVAEAARAVTDGPEDGAAGGLLELTALVTAVLYTQGDTAVPGEPTPIPSTSLGGAANTSARLLKPLLDALTTTGAGRLELVKEGHQRGAFADLRLVGPAVAGLDDPYSDVADFLADTVIPGYGPAVVPLVRAGYDPQGGRGNPRRLKLLHRLDASGSRELVLAGLEGAKEVRVAAVSCLGADDLPLLLTHAAGKNKEVRAAAFEALARFDHPEALAAVAKGLAGKDYEAAADAVGLGKSEPAVGALAAAVTAGADALSPKTDKKALGTQLVRLEYLIHALPDGSPAAEPVLLALFARRAEFAKLKGDGRSGIDLNEVVVRAMADGVPAVQRALVAAHADLGPHALERAATAARRAFPPAQFYDTFAPYLADTKGAGGDKYCRQGALVNALDAGRDYYRRQDQAPTADLDPRWLDAAVEHKLVSLVFAAGRPGHKPAERFLSAEYDRLVKAAAGWRDLPDVLAAMNRIDHPDTADKLAEAAERSSHKRQWHGGLYSLVPHLPKAAIPVLEAVAPKIADEYYRKRWVRAVEELRDKSNA